MKNVIITGAANGVGKAIANMLKEERLILIDIDENNLKQVAEETKSKYYTCDVSDDKQNPDETDSITVNMGGKKMGLFGTPLTAAGAALMNTKAENLNKSMESKEKEAEYDIAVDADKREMYTDICKMVKTYRFRDVLGDKLIKFSGVTDGYWKDLESKGKEYMIISIGAGDYVRPAGVQGGDLSNKDITDKFVIINGIK